MNPLLIISTIILSLLLLAALIFVALKQRNMDKWIGSYAFPSEPRHAWNPDQPVDVFIAICDHWEPQCYGASHAEAVARVHRWRDKYPVLFEKYRDTNGRPPQYTFFFPEDEYHPRYLDDIKPLCEAGFGDVEIHLHHHNDTSLQLRDKLEAFRETLHHKHGLLRRDPVTNEIVYGFIHGNWSLCNSLPDGSLCGVNDELTILLETGCYADFTLPSAPSVAQTTTINSIYYAKDIPGQPKSHNTGIRARVGQTPPDNQLLLIQGPLSLDWTSRKFGIVPRIENGDIHGSRAATFARFKMWLNSGVCVAGKPDWRFIKLYSHGCKNENINTLLGPSMQMFHQQLADYHTENPNLRYHYVTAYEMAQLVHQAEQGALSPSLSTPVHT